MTAGNGLIVKTWAIRRIKALPKQVDFEIPLRERYEGKPYVWNNVKVTQEEQTLPAGVTDFHTLTLSHLRWQPKFTTAKTSDGRGSSYLREPSVCFEWVVKQTKTPPDPVVSRRLEIFTAEGRSLSYRGGVGIIVGRLSHYRCERPQTLRIKWTPTHARDTGKTFIFSGIRPQPLDKP